MVTAQGINMTDEDIKELEQLEESLWKRETRFDEAYINMRNRTLYNKEYNRGEDKKKEPTYG
jgi:hypothetical protein